MTGTAVFVLIRLQIPLALLALQWTVRAKAWMDNDPLPIGFGARYYVRIRFE